MAPHSSRPRGWRWRNLPIPETHVAGLATGAVLHLRAGRPVLADARTARALGTALAILGVALAAVATHAAADVELERPDRLVTSGPYALSRNPMYVAWTLVYAGAATLTGSGRTWALLPLVATAVHGTVLREERSLADNPTLGAAYRDYRARTRRYV